VLDRALKKQELVGGNAMSASHQAYRHARLERLLDDSQTLSSADGAEPM
jgi:hypothetical protein